MAVLNLHAMITLVVVVSRFPFQQNEAKCRLHQSRDLPVDVLVDVLTSNEKTTIISDALTICERGFVEELYLLLLS